MSSITVTPDEKGRLVQAIREIVGDPREAVFVCIGTDRSTGDSLGPLVGDMLAQAGFEVAGTLADPIHAANLHDRLPDLEQQANRQGKRLIAIDSGLGKNESVGTIRVKSGPVKPGTGVNKELGQVGDANIVGFVNVGGFMEYLVLQNTRLSLVMNMARAIFGGIAEAAHAPSS